MRMTLSDILKLNDFTASLVESWQIQQVIPEAEAGVIATDLSSTSMPIRLAELGFLYQLLEDALEQEAQDLEDELELQQMREEEEDDLWDYDVDVDRDPWTDVDEDDEPNDWHSGRFGGDILR